MDTMVAVLVVVSVIGMAIFVAFQQRCRGSVDEHPKALSSQTSC